MTVTISTVLMETDPCNLSLTALAVGGTLGNDTIAITPVSGGGVQVGMNFVNYGSFFPTGHVLVYGQSGNDIIKTAPRTINGVFTYVTVPLLVFAGDGNDILNVSGSSSGNVLVGGAGVDRLIGGQGPDILIGGSGPSLLQAGNGGAILIGGTTSYDGNAAALAAFLAEWDRTDIDYATRIAHLTGSLAGGLNGAYFLNSSTVQADGTINILVGGPGLDWYFAGITDLVFNRTAGEVIIQV
jgi:Ca2+-binding RTX toxin-like protein